MRNIKLTIEYDGTNYHGWQSQINARAVQDVLKSAIEKITSESIQLIGSGRTDEGVHAIGQIANFKTASGIPAEKFSYAINSLLPKDIVIRSSEPVPEDFHARFSAKGKKYSYLIYNSKHPSALMRNRVWHISRELNLNKMKDASKYFLGEHDFSAFRASGSSTRSSVRTIKSLELSIKNELITIEISGNGFLYNMVRIIAGTLVDVGLGKIDVDIIPNIIESLEREKAGRTAPPCGLYLIEVYY